MEGREEVQFCLSPGLSTKGKEGEFQRTQSKFQGIDTLLQRKILYKMSPKCQCKAESLSLGCLQQIRSNPIAMAPRLISRLSIPWGLSCFVFKGEDVSVFALLCFVKLNCRELMNNRKSTKDCEISTGTKRNF